MGYFGSMRSAQEVQYSQGNKMDFEKVKSKYESTIPIRGKRKALDIRPLGVRSRSWERVVKANDNEYFITNGGRWLPQGNEPRCLTWQMIDGVEYLTVHAPHWYKSDGTKTYNGRPLHCPSDFYFYHYNLPDGIAMYNHRGRKYVAHDGKYYSIGNKTDVIFQRIGKNQWQLRQASSEVVHHIDRKKKKQIKDQIKPLTDYLDVMYDIVEPKRHWRNMFTTSLVGHLLKYDQNPHPEWVEMAEEYKARTREAFWDENRNWKEFYNKNKLLENVLHDATIAFKPFKVIEVPLGNLAYDRYRSWIGE